MECYVVHVTKLCNLNCKYCYEDDKTSTYTWKEVKKLIDNIVKFNKEKSFIIEFLGGEPMLGFHLIKKSVEYLESIKEVEIPEYIITTNGTILDDDILSFLKENPKITFAISLDGNNFMNQSRVFKENNKNSHSKVMENIKILQQSINIDRLPVHMVSHHYNVGYLSKGIEYLYNKGIKRIGVGTIEKTMVIDEDYCKRFIDELDIISRKIVSGELGDLSIDLFNWLKPKTDERTYIKDDSGKIIGETYGRAKEDITKTEVYNSVVTHSPIGDTIYNLRKTVFENHKKNIDNMGGM